MKKYDLIIKAGLLISMAEKQRWVNNVYIMISKGKIKKIAHRWEKDKISAYEYIDATEGIVMPGLINCHTHLAMTLLRGIADDMPLEKWLFEKIFPWEAKNMDPETVYAGALLGCAELIWHGTTCIADGYFFQDSTIKALDKAGLRGLIAQGIIDFPSPDIPEPEENITVAHRFMEKWKGYSELITPGIFCHSPYTCSKDTLKKAKGLSEKFGVPMQIHLSETVQEVKEIKKRTGKRPVHYLNDIGILKEDTIAAHAIHLDANEIRLAAQKGLRIVHVPESNMKLASGVAPVARFIKSGITTGIGTDGCASNNNLNLFCEMDITAKLSKVVNKDPRSLDAYTLLKMATIWGAKVIGMEDKIGTIEEGKAADIIVLDLNAPYMHPLYNPVASLVYSQTGGSVRDVIINGRIIMKDKKILTIDTQEIIDRIRFVCKRLEK